jgi:hypothetical protein
MKCKKCDKYFARRVNIDGKRRHLGSRLYCFECSPFGKHNTRKLDATSSEPGTYLPGTCSVCAKTYPRKRSVSKNICPSCRVSRHRIKIKKQLADLLGGKCIVCNYDKCLGALEFHHRDSDQKERTISGSTISKKILILEAKKCVLLCCRCHRELHAGLLNIDGE